MTLRLPRIAENSVKKTFPNYANNRYLLVVRMMVVVFVLGVSFSAGFFSSGPVTIYVGSGLLFITFFIIHNRHGWFGFLIFILASFFLTAPAFFGSLVYLPMSFFAVMALGLMWLVRMLLLERHIVLNTARAVYAAIALSVVAMLSMVAGFLPWFPVPGADTLSQMTGLAIFVITSLAFLVGVHEIKREKHLKIIVYVYLGLVSIMIFGAIFPFLRAPLITAFLPGARGSMLFNWVGALAFSQGLINTRLRWRWRLFFIALSATLILVSFSLNRAWVSGWLPVLAAMGFIAWIRFRRWRVIMVLFAFVAVIFFLQSPIWQTLVAENSYSLLTRNATYAIIYEIVKANPILGLGPSNYYFYTPLFSILGWYVQFNSHNQYVDLIAQVGILGLLVYLWLIFEIVMYAWRGVHQFRAGFPRAYAYGVLGAMAGMLVAGMLGDWTIPFLYNIGARGLSATLPGWVFAGGIFALGEHLKMQKAQQEVETDSEA